MTDSSDNTKKEDAPLLNPNTVSKVLHSSDFNEELFKDTVVEFLKVCIDVATVYIKTEPLAKKAAEHVTAAHLDLIDKEYPSDIIIPSLLEVLDDNSGGFHIDDIGKFLVSSKKGIEFTHKGKKHRIPVSQLYRQATIIENSYHKIVSNSEEKENKVRLFMRKERTLRAQFVLCLVSMMYEGMKKNKSLSYSCYKDKMIECINKVNRLLYSSDNLESSKQWGIMGTIQEMIMEAVPGITSITSSLGIEDKAQTMAEKAREVNFGELRTKGTSVFNKVVAFFTANNIAVIKRYLLELKKDEKCRQVLQDVLKDCMAMIVERFSKDDVIDVLRLSEKALREGAKETGQALDFDYTVDDLVKGMKEMDTESMSSVFMNM